MSKMNFTLSTYSNVRVCVKVVNEIEIKRIRLLEKLSVISDAVFYDIVQWKLEFFFCFCCYDNNLVKFLYNFDKIHLKPRVFNRKHNNYKYSTFEQKSFPVIISISKNVNWKSLELSWNHKYEHFLTFISTSTSQTN